MSIKPYTTQTGKRWRVRYTSPTGKRTDKRGFKTKTEAQQWLYKHYAQRDNPNTQTTPLKDLAPAFIDTIKHTSYKTQQTYLGSLNNHVLPAWGNKTGAELTTRDIQQWVNTHFTARSTAAIAISVLKQLWELEASNNNPNPLTKIKLPARTQPPRAYLTPQQVQLLADNSTIPLVIHTLATTGIRIGELIGLHVEDINLTTNHIHIKRTVHYEGKQFHINPPKSRKERIISAPPYVMQQLIQLTPNKPTNTPLFLSKNGTYTPTFTIQNAFKRAKKLSSHQDPQFPPHLRIHDLRHTAASLLVKSGAHIKVVQAQLGHAQASMTLDVYADLFPQDLSTVAHTMERLFSGGQNVGTEQ